MRAKLQENSYIEVFCVAGQDTYLVELSGVCSERKLVEFTDGCRSRRTKAKPKFLFFRNSFVQFSNAAAARIERHLATCNWFVGGRGPRMRARFGGCGFDARCVALLRCRRLDTVL